MTTEVICGNERIDLALLMLLTSECDIEEDPVIDVRALVSIHT